MQSTRHTACCTLLLAALVGLPAVAVHAAYGVQHRCCGQQCIVHGKLLV